MHDKSMKDVVYPILCTYFAYFELLRPKRESIKESDRGMTYDYHVNLSQALGTRYRSQKACSANEIEQFRKEICATRYREGGNLG